MLCESEEQHLQRTDIHRMYTEIRCNVYRGGKGACGAWGRGCWGGGGGGKANDTFKVT